MGRSRTSEFQGRGVPTPATTEEIVAAHDDGVEDEKQTLGELGDDGLKDMWPAKAGDMA